MLTANRFIVNLLAVVIMGFGATAAASTDPGKIRMAALTLSTLFFISRSSPNYDRLPLSMTMRW